jgi:hypothetical protein
MRRIEICGAGGNPDENGSETCTWKPYRLISKLG